MESPLLSKSEHNIDDTIHGGPFSNDEHIVDITNNGDSSSNDEHSVDITNDGDSSSKDEHVDDIANDGDASSADTQTPQEGVQITSNSSSFANVWILVEFVATLVQIVAAIVVLIQPKDEEHEQTFLFTWIIGYTCGCIAILPILCLRFWYYNRSASSESRGEEVMDSLETILEYFFVGWVVTSLWVFLTDSSCFLNDTQHLWLYMALLAFSCIRYVLSKFKCAEECFLFPIGLLFNKLREFTEKMFTLIIYLLACIAGIFGCICGSG